MVELSSEGHDVGSQAHLLLLCPVAISKLLQVVISILHSNVILETTRDYCGLLEITRDY